MLKHKLFTILLHTVIIECIGISFLCHGRASDLQESRSQIKSLVPSVKTIYSKNLDRHKERGINGMVMDQFFNNDNSDLTTWNKQDLYALKTSLRSFYKITDNIAQNCEQFATVLDLPLIGRCVGYAACLAGGCIYDTSEAVEEFRKTAQDLRSAMLHTVIIECKVEEELAARDSGSFE
jgi:hypothetical protein